MQIFILDYDIKKNTEYYCDKHINKILTEICQMLSTVYRDFTIDKEAPDFIYKATHRKHPCVLWIKKKWANMKYTIDLANALYNEYQFRYNKPDKHIRNKKIIDFCYKHLSSVIDENLTPFALAMPDKYKTDDTVKSYRNYYLGEKKHLFKWTNRETPYWIKEIQKEEKQR